MTHNPLIMIRCMPDQSDLLSSSAVTATSFGILLHGVGFGEEGTPDHFQSLTRQVHAPRHHPACTISPMDETAVLAWEAGVERVCAMDRPALIPSCRWMRLMDDAVLFLPRWGTAAASLGWHTLDLFGAGQDAPDQRLDLMGLVVSTGGKAVVELTATTARLQCPDGTMQTYYRKPDQPGWVPLWELE